MPDLLDVHPDHRAALRPAHNPMHRTHDTRARGLHDDHRRQSRDHHGAGLQPGLPYDAVGDVLPRLPDHSCLLAVALRGRYGRHAAWAWGAQLDDYYGGAAQVSCHDDVYHSAADHEVYFV